MTLKNYVGAALNPNKLTKLSAKLLSIRTWQWLDPKQDKSIMSDSTCHTVSERHKS